MASKMNLMKRKIFKYNLLFSIFLFVFGINAQTQTWIYFTGSVLDEDSQLPISSHPVFISDRDSIPMTFTFTNEDGVYFDSIFIDPAGFGDNITVSTPDCEGMMHHVFFTELDSINHADFSICNAEGGCHALFYYEFDFSDPYLLHFTDFSQGNVNSWSWTFGDGMASAEQNPSHHYNSPGAYEVCLIIQNTNSDCIDSICEFIMVGDSICNADFSWYADDDDPMKIIFTDQSIGDINYWLWDFGDEQISEEQSPAHVYNFEGQYYVTLTVFDTMGICFDMISKWVNVIDSSECMAYFETVLDTLNNTPHVYHFENKSLGNFDSWHWDFGDGEVSYDLNPTHVFGEEGTYEVCLFISSNNSGMCSDQYCETIETMQYFNFGGHVFLGDFPLNVEEDDSANIAIASLYRRYKNQWQLMDTREFWKYGYYWFVDKPAGEYIIRADLLASSVDFGAYPPSYTDDARFWEGAQTFVLSDSGEFAVDVYLNPVFDYEPGIGSIAGSVEPGIECADGITPDNELVYLLNAENQIISYTYTNMFGKFNFDGIGFGNYRVKAEVTGKWSDAYVLTLDAKNPSYSDINLEFQCNSFVDIEEFKPDENAFNISAIYPVPADEQLTIEISSQIVSNITVQLINTNGMIVFNLVENINNGNKKIKLRTDQLPSGIYLVRVLTGGRNQYKTKKIIIN